MEEPLLWMGPFGHYGPSICAFQGCLHLPLQGDKCHKSHAFNLFTFYNMTYLFNLQKKTSSSLFHAVIISVSFTKKFHLDCYDNYEFCVESE